MSVPISAEHPPVAAEPATLDCCPGIEATVGQTWLAAWDERDRRQRALEREKLQAVLLATLECMTEGVLAVGHDGTVIVANPAACRLFGRPLEQLAAQRIDTVLAGIDGGAELLQTLRGAAGGGCEMMWAKEGGAGQGTRWIRLRARRAMAPCDRHLAGLVVAEDRTLLHRLERQAALRQRLSGMGELAAALAHEVRNPLGAIALYATTLAAELADGDPRRELAVRIAEGVQMVERIVADALAIARPRRRPAGRVNLARVLAETLAYLDHPLREKGIDVECNVDVHPFAWVAGEAEPLRQVFLNLALNALQAMDEGGRLRVALMPEAAGWSVEVADSGVGMEPEVMARMFDPFFTTRDEGSGLGLAVVHAILDAHGASIDVRSQPGAGTIVRVVFPPIETAAAAVTPATVAAGKPV